MDEKNKKNIKINLDIIRNNMLKCLPYRGDGKDVTLVAVSKYYPYEYIQSANEFGQIDFAESRVQELLDKQDVIAQDINWHFIGHLQTNKVKYILNKVHLLHSLDSIKLAREIDKQCSKIDSKMDVLLQINVSKEESKFGIYEQDVYEFIENISHLKNINVKGFMTMAPYTDNECLIGKTFGGLRKIFDEFVCQKLPENVEMKYLSMGMTNDYIIALKEGSNMLRIGSGIFGEKM